MAYKRSPMPPARQVFSDWRMFLAFGFGSGLARIMPGTFGTLAAVPLYLLFAELPLWLYAALVAAAWLFGNHICTYASNKLGVHDHGGIVWDEFAGFWLAMFAAPAGWHWLLIGFVLFRFFDMVKPWPISWLDQKVKGGAGIMIDDIVAGLFTFVCIQASVHFFAL
ncbi:phosphatidylglycerophosphatase A family protein [Agaribacterium haliotis]|uniref:phosphatidylglycerophosphatase A family protein n=1 Tax=Agaribacterium haliotis TaxID=2013869 RepID=UPI001EFDA014|nr:phosphatidylglycerophosphatase A [Agaribacterium haliotis]